MNIKIQSFCNIIHYTTQKLGVSIIIIVFFFFWGEYSYLLLVMNINTFIYQGCFKLIKSHDKDIYTF